MFPGCSRVPEQSFQSAEPRVVSLAPSITEMICAIGAEKQLVGRTSACDYPPDIVKTVPVIGGFGKPSMDLLLRVKPTLVLEADLEDESVGRLMDQLGVKRMRLKCSRLDDIPPALLLLGQLLHQEKSALVLVEKINRRIVELRTAAGHRQKAGQYLSSAKQDIPAVFTEIWGDPLTTVGKQSFVSELIQLAGGRNLGDEVSDKDYFQVSPEWVIARDPDIIVCLYMARDVAIRDAVAARMGWSQVKAVRHQRVYGHLDNDVILRPGPRVLDGIEALRRCIEDPPRAAPYPSKVDPP